MILRFGYHTGVVSFNILTVSLKYHGIQGTHVYLLQVMIILICTLLTLQYLMENMILDLII